MEVAHALLIHNILLYLYQPFLKCLNHLNFFPLSFTNCETVPTAQLPTIWSSDIWVNSQLHELICNILVKFVTSW